MPVSWLTLLVAAVAGAVATLWWVDPAAAGWLPQCPLHLLTGWHCPGCGATRAAHALLHGDVAQALAKNPLLVCVAPPAAAYWVWNRVRRGPGWATSVPHRAILVVLVVMIVYGVLRNLPFYPLTLLAPH